LETVLGVHTRLTDEVEEAKIARTLEMVRAMGAGWIVEYFPWAYMEPDRGRYDWHHADLVVEHASRLGLRVVARIDYVPAWARPPDSPTRLLPASAYADYAAFVARFAARYAGRVQYIVIWNEPNVSFEWGIRAPPAGRLSGGEGGGAGDPGGERGTGPHTGAQRVGAG